MYAEDRVWPMIKSWAAHMLVTAVLGAPSIIFADPAWAIAAAMGYVFREFIQHDVAGTSGVIEWVDRIGDAVFPLLVAVVYEVVLS